MYTRRSTGALRDWHGGATQNAIVLALRALAARRFEPRNCSQQHELEKDMNMQAQTKLLITENDARHLRTMLERPELFSERDRVQCQALEEEIERAKVVPSDQIPSDVVTMHSRVRIVDMRTGEQLVYQIVYPHEANYSEKRISILAPIGMALLGYSAGTEIDWTVPSGSRRLRIEAVEHQSASARRRTAA
jgi:regulator of nucleoside diphosphate kinase